MYCHSISKTKQSILYFQLSKKYTVLLSIHKEMFYKFLLTVNICHSMLVPLNGKIELENISISTSDILLHRNDD